ncbi:MAG: DUF3048 domain-containing protein [Aquiluna sp.]|nr:DUF3048 domain-containing protein [Aquiluna sp.]
MRAIKISSLFLIAALTVSGCTAAADEDPVGTATPSPVVTQEPEPEPVYVTAALTGVEYLEGENPFLDMPAISAKIDNTFDGRPQLALNDADIVYVTRVEVGLTRLLPVWHSRVPIEIGPVRSVRPVDASIVDPFNGVFVYSGGQVPFKSAATSTGLVISDEDTEMNNETYFRESTRKAPWNLFFRAQKLQELYRNDQPAPNVGFQFDAIPSAVSQGVVVVGLDVDYPQLTSRWDLGTAQFPWETVPQVAWSRTQNGTPHLQFGGDQVVAKNVVVMEVVHDLSFVDPKYGAIPKAKLENNEGIAHVFSDGYYIQGTWSKGSSEDPIRLATSSGQELKLAVGNTWVEMMDIPKSKLIIEYPEAQTEG